MAAKPALDELLLGGPGHDGYTYNADVYCVDCGQDIIRDLYAKGKYDEGDNGDSEEFPQPIFFGESDGAEHCGSCGEYMYGEDEPECIRCGMPASEDNECDRCGNLSCDAHSEHCDQCDQSLCYECKARKHDHEDDES